jgi:hypothetical protein
VIAAASLALALAAAPPDAALRAEPLAQEEYEGPFEDGEEGRPRVLLSAWGGEVLDDAGSGKSSGFLGAEVAYAFEAIDVGLAGYGYRDLADAERAWTPVVLVRLTQRFRTRRTVEAAFSLGVGAGRPDDWEAWYQVALGIRVGYGPMFLAGELAFEQGDLLRLGAGLGVAF